MEQLIIIVHVLAALAIIGLILLQQGKGAEAGASFGGGAAQTVFGSKGTGNFFSRATGIFSLIFFVTSFGLAIVAKNKAEVQANVGIPAVVEQVSPDLGAEVPVVDDAPSDVPEVPEQ
ncbi:preprotein translocase subunit SecG [Simiduia curdlanivorans]|uniref:Protein-export membrane protein SecG n=1 Tax=Simiduia curdlanivorans TaxID=1492769 RepID=A0ABV8V459_9GAMM|nr:preprotein translocase subunit SecG [Simiduia curdlanivorans]MDN3640894.1 preprotein translocase subunit SecG [Simiduia curdlanivorans]